MSESFNAATRHISESEIRYQKEIAEKIRLGFEKSGRKPLAFYRNLRLSAKLE